MPSSRTRSDDLGVSVNCGVLLWASSVRDLCIWFHVKGHPFLEIPILSFFRLGVVEAGSAAFRETPGSR